jgi:prepilin-type N-terminal cleavage/methylation domain-containing protein
MKNQPGFTLIETMIALVILGIIALMAEEGLSGSLRVKEKVEEQISDQDHLMTMVRYLQSDCAAISIMNGEQQPPSFVQGKQFVWLFRHVSSRQDYGWQFVGYKVEDHALKRYVSQTFIGKQEGLLALESLSKDPDQGIQTTSLSYEIEGVENQNFQAIWGDINKKNLQGLQISVTFIGKKAPLTISCSAEGYL